jgi:hypothetical protein
MLEDILATDPVVEPVEPVKADSPALPWNAEEPKVEEDQTKDNNLLMALDHLAKEHDGTLMFIRLATGEPFQVKNFNPEDGYTTLESQSGRTFKVRVTEREAKFYRPQWR